MSDFLSLLVTEGGTVTLLIIIILVLGGVIYRFYQDKSKEIDYLRQENDRKTEMLNKQQDLLGSSQEEKNNLTIIIKEVIQSNQNKLPPKE